MSVLSEDADSQEAPILTYSNRIQKQFDQLSYIMSRSTDMMVIVPPLRMLLRNFPPKGKEVFKAERAKLTQFDSNNKLIEPIEAEEIYDNAHDWFYIHVLQDAFRFRPRNPKPAHIGGGKD